MCSCHQGVLLLLGHFLQQNMQQPKDTLSISTIWRGKNFIVETNSDATLKKFGHELQKLTGVKADTMRLIVPQPSNKGSKLLSPFSDEHMHLSLQETSILQVPFFIFIMHFTNVSDH